MVESSSLVSVLFREVFSHSYISCFHLLVNVFYIASFCGPLTLFIMVRGIRGGGGGGRIKMASASTQPANEPANYLILVQLKPMIYIHFYLNKGTVASIIN